MDMVRAKPFKVQNKAIFDSIGIYMYLGYQADYDMPTLCLVYTRCIQVYTYQAVIHLVYTGYFISFQYMYSTSNSR